MRKEQQPIHFGREKRLLLGALAFLTPLPLPFNEVTGWPQLALYWLAVGLFIGRAWRGEEVWLPYWAMNLLAIFYLPFLALDLSVLWRGRVLQPLVHLVLFALAVKLWGLHREKEKWHAVLAIFFLFVAAMGTSVHPAVLAYFVAHMGLTLLLLARFAAAHLLQRHARRGAVSAAVPMGGFVVPGVLGSLLLAVPLFVILPRFQNPYISVAGPGGGGVNTIERLRDRLDLDTIGRARNDRAVVMRLAYESSPPAGHEARFRAAVYDRFEDNSWRRSRGGFDLLRRGPAGAFALAAAPIRGWMEIWLQPQGQAELVLPVDAASVEVAATRVAVQGSGVVALPVRPSGTLNFRAGLSGRPLLPELSATVATAEESRGEGISPRIRELAAGVMGEGSDGERAERATGWLRREYSYTLDLMDSPAADPIEEFLFRNRAGHCELFASSLVLMLRSQGVPARLVTGYLGTEFNPLEGYHIVRNSNAHAWVEALTGEDGWRILDPTPAAGLPQAAEPGLLALMQQAWDYLEFRWDRYVISYGFYDQAQAFFGLRSLWLDLRRMLFGREARPDVARPAEPEPPAEDRPETIDPADGPALAAWLPLLVLLLTAGIWWRFGRRQFTATRAYERLRGRLQAIDPEIGPAMPPLALAHRLAERFPAAAPPADSLVRLYLRESFGGERLAGGELVRARELLKGALRGMRLQRRLR
jgi:transglutaminase-like putative cysteine protease